MDHTSTAALRLARRCRPHRARKVAEGSLCTDRSFAIFSRFLLRFRPFHCQLEEFRFFGTQFPQLGCCYAAGRGGYAAILLIWFDWIDSGPWIFQLIWQRWLIHWFCVCGVLMDLVKAARAKLEHFRIKELKDVLSELSLAKQGKKQELLDRISALLSNENVSESHFSGTPSSIGVGIVVQIIDDIYRKMQDSGATELTSKSHSSSDLNNRMMSKVEIDDSHELDMKVRCSCGSSLITDSIIKCEDHHCQVWQHFNCMMMLEKFIQGSQPIVPSPFYCELCRLNRADPFWVTVRHPMFPFRLTFSDRTKLNQNVEKSFVLSRADRELLHKSEYDLQVWCVLLSDPVYFRMHWPQHSELLVNGIQIRTTNRPGQLLLGINGRDDGPLLKTCTREGINKISLSGCDNRIFCGGVRLVKRRTFLQVLNMVPKEPEGESLDDAIARVHRAIGSGNATENTDGDSDIEMVSDSVTVNLRCPMSGSRMKIAGRFRSCVHMSCFDLETFIELNQRSRKWQCPTCLKNYSLESIIIDPYFNRITSIMRNCGEDMNEIEVRVDGSWRAKNEGECKDRDLYLWHLPDGSLCTVPDVEKKTSFETPRQFKYADTSEGPSVLRFDLKKRKSDGKWEVKKSDNYRTRVNNVYEKSEKVLFFDSSAIGSYRDGEDPSVNQGVLFELSSSTGHVLDSFRDSIDQTFPVDSGVPPAPTKDPNIITISDSEEEDMSTSFAQTIHTAPSNANGNGMTWSVNDPIIPPDLSLSTSGNYFLNNINDFGLPLWPMQTNPTEFQLFNSDINAPYALIDTCAIVFDGHGNVSQEKNTVSTPNADLCGSLVDNPLAFGVDDPSLQNFLPTRPDSEQVQLDVLEHSKISDIVQAEKDDWISLTLGSGGIQTEAAPTCVQNSSKQILQAAKEIWPLDDNASMFLKTGDMGIKKVTLNSQRSGSFFHPSHQPRSAKPRLEFSMEMDSATQ